MQGTLYLQFVKFFLKKCHYFGISTYQVSKKFAIPKNTACRLYNGLKTVKLKDHLNKSPKTAHKRLY